MSKKVPLFDYIMKHHDCKSDSGIANFLEMHSSNMSRIRTGEKRPGAKLILAAYDKTGLSIEEIREMLK